MKLRTRFCQSFAITAGLTLAGVVSAGDLAVAGGVRASTPLPAGQPLTAPVGLDDSFNVLREKLAMPTPVFTDADSGPKAPVAVSRPAWRTLTGFGTEVRENATIDIELPGNVAANARALSVEAETLWNSGRFDAAIDLVRTLEAAGTPMDFGVAWKRPRVLAAIGAEDVRVGDPRDTAQDATVDYDGGVLFSIVLWGPDSEAMSYWTMNMSSDGGTTWVETYAFFSTLGLTDAHGSCVFDYIYVGYVSNTATNEARMRRCTSNDGQIDDVYAHQVVLDASPGSVVDVTTATNADDFNNRMYYAIIQSDNDFRFAFADAVDGLFTEIVNSVNNALTGLSLTWDEGFACEQFLFLSYLGIDDAVHILGLGNSGVPIEFFVDPDTVLGTPTSISMFDTTVICAFEHPGPNGRGIKYQISYDCGDTWNFGGPDPGPGDGNYGNPAVTARGGQGTAMVFSAETGEPDKFFLTSRSGYFPGFWAAPVQTNENDVRTGMNTAINWLPPVCNGRGYGDLYIGGLLQGVPYFDYAGSACPGDTDGSRTVEFGDIIAMLRDWGSTDTTRSDANCDGIVSFADILIVLGGWGPCGP